MITDNKTLINKWWKVCCMLTDVVQYSGGSLSKTEFIQYMRHDIKHLNELLDELESEEDSNE
jgi:hypothetical protein